MEAATKICTQKLRHTSSVLLAIVILIFCQAQFTADVKKEPTEPNVIILHQTDSHGVNVN